MAVTEEREIRKRDYKQLLSRYKNVEEANDFFKLQLQDLNARLKIEHKEKERLRHELSKARSEIVKKQAAHGSLQYSDVEEVNSRLKEAYQKLEEEFELRDQLNKDLEYTKAMLLAEGRTRMLLENRNTILEQEMKNMTSGKAGNDALSQLEETKQRLEEEIKGRLALQEAKEALEAELEDLTKSLFEEANTMVSKEAREKYELQLVKKRVTILSDGLEQELELAKSKILMDEKLLTSMKNKFTSLELKAKKLHRRTGSSSSAVAAANGAQLTAAQLRATSSHPNLLTLRDDVELRQRSLSCLIGQQSSSLPSSPVTNNINNPIHASPIASPTHSNAILSPEVTSTQSQPQPIPSNPLSPHPITPTGTPSSSPIKALPMSLSDNASNPVSIPTNPTTNPVSTSPVYSSINPVSTSPVSGQDYTLTTGTAGSSDDTFSELSQQDTASIAEGDEWDVDWLLEEGREEKGEDDTVLFVEVEGNIDLQSGLSHFVQFLSVAKQDWTGRFMDRVIRDDVGPCLRLRSQEDRAYRKLLEAVWHNRIFVEPLATTLKETCAGCGAESTCRWRVKMGSSHDSKNMGDLCRERIVRTCDFYVYLRNLRQGLVKKTLPNIYKEFLRLRLMMNFARVCAG